MTFGRFTLLGLQADYIMLHMRDALLSLRSAFYCAVGADGKPPALWAVRLHLRTALESIRAARRWNEDMYR